MILELSESWSNLQVFMYKSGKCAIYSAAFHLNPRGFPFSFETDICHMKLSFPSPSPYAQMWFVHLFQCWRRWMRLLSKAVFVRQKGTLNHLIWGWAPHNASHVCMSAKPKWMLSVFTGGEMKNLLCIVWFWTNCKLMNSEWTQKEIINVHWVVLSCLAF